MGMIRGLVMALLAGLLVVSLFPPRPVAAEEGEVASEAGARPGRIDELVEALEKTESPEFAPVPVEPGWLDEEGRAAQRHAFKDYYNYRSVGFDHRRRVFEWQLLSSKVIFVLVISLVTVGIFFSWLQFRQGLRAGGRAGPESETTFEATAKGIKVTSPVLGVIILTISLAFFYLYLVYVYPIEEIL